MRHEHLPRRRRFGLLRKLTIGMVGGVLLGMLALLASPLQADDVSSNAASSTAAGSNVANPAAIDPGHSAHGEAFDEGPRQRAYLMEGMPKVNLPVTTKSTEAQDFFNQGLAQLHGFWYFEAERSFRQVLAIDPDCVMAYWGMAMANVNNAKRAKAFMAQADKGKGFVSPRERAWIEPFVAYYNAPNKAERDKQLIRGLETIVQDYPEDVEAKAFLVLTIWNAGENRHVPIGSYQAVDALLDQIFVAAPMHPAHHYRIHLWNGVKAERAQKSSALCGQTSPGIAHMWHMPGHIFSEEHRYADAAWHQEASARVDHYHMMRDGVLPDQIHNYAHNNEWLIRDLCFIGRAHDAVSLAENMVELPRHPKYNTLSKRGSASLGRDRLIESLVLYEDWAELVRVSQGMYLDGLDKPEQVIRRLRIVGRAQFSLGHAEEGKKAIADLEAIRKERQAVRYAAADAAETKARSEKKSEEDVTKAMAEALKSQAGPVQIVDRAISELKGYAALAAGDTKTAKTEFDPIIDKLREANELRRDQLAHVCSLLGDHPRAETLAREAVKSGPEEAYPLATLVEVLHRAGKKAEATAEFEKLRAMSAYFDLDAPVFDRLKPLAKELNLPDDWRAAKITPADAGDRPNLDSLGPFRWQPSPAPSWTLPSAAGEMVSSDAFRGKPVVVIFYLGSGCLHCVEQVKKFMPMTDQFNAAGISLLAISSEKLDSLQTSVTAFSDKPFPFPLMADPEKSVFRSYRAYDDFEKTPLHGVFLIDGAGLIRWQDIGYEPFTDAQFVLDEARRLLRH